MEKQKDVFITLNDKEVKLPRTFKEKVLWLGPSLVLWIWRSNYHPLLRSDVWTGIIMGSSNVRFMQSVYYRTSRSIYSGIRRILCSWFVQSPWTKRLGDRYHVYPLDLHCILPGSRLAAWSRCCRIWCIALYGCYL